MSVLHFDDYQLNGNVRFGSGAALERPAGPGQKQTSNANRVHWDDCKYGKNRLEGDSWFVGLIRSVTAALERKRRVNQSLQPARVGKPPQVGSTSTLGRITYSVGNCSFTIGQQSAPLLAFRVESGLLHVSGVLRDETGQIAIVLRPGASPEFVIPKASLTQVGAGPLLVSSEPVGSFVVEMDGRTVLAVRTNHTQRAVVFAMELRDENGRVVASIEKDSLTLKGANLHFG